MGIQRPHVGVQRRGTVAARHGADVRMAVDHAGQQHPARQVVFYRSPRRGQIRPADLHDGAAPNDQNAGFDWRTCNRQDVRASEDVGLVLRRGRRLQPGQRKHEQE